MQNRAAAFLKMHGFMSITTLPLFVFPNLQSKRSVWKWSWLLLNECVGVPLMFVTSDWLIYLPWLCLAQKLWTSQSWSGTLKEVGVWLWQMQCYFFGGAGRGVDVGTLIFMFAMKLGLYSFIGKKKKCSCAKILKILIREEHTAYNMCL